jgi:hypothetical protein
MMENHKEHYKVNQLKNAKLNAIFMDVAANVTLFFEP